MSGAAWRIPGRVGWRRGTEAAPRRGAGVRGPQRRRGIAGPAMAGTVLDRSLRPIRGATVTLVELDATTLSDDAGLYRLPLPADLPPGGEATLRVSAAGYAAAELRIRLGPGETRLDITLDRETRPSSSWMACASRAGSAT